MSYRQFIIPLVKILKETIARKIKAGVGSASISLHTRCENGRLKIARVRDETTTRRIPPEENVFMTVDQAGEWLTSVVDENQERSYWGTADIIVDVNQGSIVAVSTINERTAKF